MQWLSLSCVYIICSDNFFLRVCVHCMQFSDYVFHVCTLYIMQWLCLSCVNKLYTMYTMQWLFFMCVYTVYLAVTMFVMCVYSVYHKVTVFVMCVYTVYHEVNMFVMCMYTVYPAVYSHCIIYTNIFTALSQNRHPQKCTKLRNSFFWYNFPWSGEKCKTNFFYWPYPT